jgi:hypothetical protein
MVVLPHLDDLVASINKEIETCHLNIDQIEELMIKRPILQKACKLVKSIEQNQRSNEVYVSLINSDIPTSSNNQFKMIEETIQ